MAKKVEPQRTRLDDYISKKQLAFLVTLAALVASHYMSWPDALIDKVVKLILWYLGTQGLVDLGLVLKGSKTR